MTQAGSELATAAGLAGALAVVVAADAANATGRGRHRHYAVLPGA